MSLKSDTLANRKKLLIGCTCMFSNTRNKFQFHSKQGGGKQEIWQKMRSGGKEYSTASYLKIS